MPSSDAAALGAAMRSFMAHAVLFQDAVAQRAGLNATALQCLNVLVMDGPMTPGALAAQAGISAGGAITAVVDRLEAEGLVTRTRDSSDRRRVLLTPDVQVAWQRLAPLYDGVQQRWNAYLDTLSPQQQEVVLDAFTTADRINRDELAHLRTTADR
jgi:DNA-binding MarR family transcriptional regulator